MEFDDGTFRKLGTGADDRAHEVDRATWRQNGGRVQQHLFAKSRADDHGVEHPWERGGLATEVEEIAREYDDNAKRAGGPN